MADYLHVIALNIPWPPNYGGVIDIYYKLKALHAQGVHIILHCFEYERPQAPELLDVCKEVYYYKRTTGLRTNLSHLPYNVYSRKDSRLIRDLLKDDYPILFEGLHSCYYLGDRRLQNRKKIFRVSNIEHDYYRHIGDAESNLLKKCFYYIEGKRFEWYERVAEHADCILTVSTADAEAMEKRFPDNRVECMPCFHPYDEVVSVPGQSDFILYHGKLSVLENQKAALFLIEQVFSKLTCKCMIVGMNPSPQLIRATEPYTHISIEANPSAERMDWLIREAQINMLITFQPTGLKLKLLNSLFAGRHTVVNSEMLTGSGLDALCQIAETPKGMIRACQELMQKPFTEADIQLRKELLFPEYSNQWQARQLKQIIYE